MLAVVGPNGAGKSTLFKGIVGLLTPLSGAIDRNAGVRDIAYLPQVKEIDRSFPINVYELVAMGLWRRIGAFGAIGKIERERIHGAIATVELTGFERRPIAGLSGGPMQRVLFARLLLQDSRLIVLTNRSTPSTTGRSRT
jgi:zinc/manganese transport system ATP-binding protein